MADQKRNIRQMERDDLQFAFHLVREVGWSDSRDELDRLLSYESDGCFIAERREGPAGMVMTTSYGLLAWIGCLIVDLRSRGRDIGSELLQQAIGYLRRKGVETIRLDAVQGAIPLYQRFGFVEESRSLRFQGIGAQHVAGDVEPMEPSHLEEVFQLDGRSFGADRSRVLRQVFQSFPELCFVSYVHGELVGYIMAKRMTVGSRVGPWICRSGNLSGSGAESLLRAALNALGDELVNVAVLEDNRTSLEFLERYGFSQGPWSLRLRLGPDRYGGITQEVLAIGSPAKG